MDDLLVNEPAPIRSRVAMRRIGAAAAVGVGLTLGAAGIAAAATDPSPTPSGGATAQTAPQMPPGPGHRHGPGGPRGERGLGLHGALHGELVVPDGTGYRTVRVQRGVVTAVSAEALTVKSEDGYESTYVLTKSTLVDAARDGIATVAKGETVGVEATVSGSKATANHVRDITKIQAERKARGEEPGGPGEPGGAAPNGTPATPSSFDDGADAQGA